MKTTSQVPAPRRVRIVVDPRDPRLATVQHDGKVLFTLRTDVSGLHPALVVAARETHLKTMTRGKTGILLWNGSPDPRGEPPSAPSAAPSRPVRSRRPPEP